MVGPVIFDAIKRYLQFKGFEVTWVVNITDVDDKLIDAANKPSTTVQELAERHTQRISRVPGGPGRRARSTDFPRHRSTSAEIIELCQTLIDKRLRLRGRRNVWFDVTKDPDYGKLSHRKVEEQEAGTRDVGGRGQAQPGRLRPLESRQAGRAGVGFALGQRPARLAHRVLGHEHEIPRRDASTSTAAGWT